MKRSLWVGLGILYACGGTGRGAEPVPTSVPQRAADGVPLLSVDAFEDVPQHVRDRLREVDCLIPQAFHSDRPHSLIKGRFAAADQEDWAALCKMGAWSGIVVVWGGPVRCVDPIAVGFDRGRFQGIGEGEVGYSRAIGTATMAQILKLAEFFDAPGPPSRDHDGIDDAFVEKASVVHYCHEGRWYRLQGAD